MNIEVEIKQYEENNKEKYVIGGFKIMSHWNRDELVVLQLSPEKTITVLARDLVKAVERCSGWGF